MTDYKPKSKKDIKADVNKEVEKIKDKEKSIDSVVKDCEKVSELSMEIKDSPTMTKDAAVLTGLAMHEAYKKTTNEFEKQDAGLETEQKNLGDLVKELYERTRSAQENAGKIKHVKDSIGTHGARTALGKAESISQQDAQLTDSEGRKAEKCRNDSRQTLHTQRNKVNRIYFPGVDNYLANEAGRQAAREVKAAIDRAKSDNQQAVKKDDLEGQIISEEKQSHDFCKPVKEMMGNYKDQIEQLKGAKPSHQEAKPDAVEQQENQNNPAYGPPLGKLYKRNES